MSIFNSSKETTLARKLEQGDDEMNTHLSNITTDHKEEKMYDNSNKIDEMNINMEESSKQVENDMITNEENREVDITRHIEKLTKCIIDDAINDVCACINIDNEALKRTEETGINLFMSLCKQTIRIEHSAQVKKLLKKRTNDYLEKKIIGTGRGKKPACDNVFLQLFYMSFAHLNINIATNAFSQKKSTYYKAYNYCKDKYEDCFDNFEKLKNRIEEDEIKSVRSLADSFIRSKSESTASTGFKSYKDDDRMFSISKKVFEDISKNNKNYTTQAEYGDFLITISVSKVSENSLQEAS